MTVVKPLLLLNNFLFKVATGKVPNPYKDKAEEDVLMDAAKRKSHDKSFGKSLSAKNLGVSEAELGPASLAKTESNRKNKKAQKGKGKGTGKGGDGSSAMVL